MSTRRDFLKKAALLSGGAGLIGTLPPSIQKAFAINPAPGTTFYDAEHVVILMQENRSFDHCFGTLQGVRGFNDPHAIKLPNQHPVWLQTNKEGETYAPFHLDIKNTKITWMGSLPHSWSNQIDAHNQGRHNRWLDVKQSGDNEYKDIPLTMGYYTREDIPFYYALADAFTVCDQHFCSSLTGTSPNRLYLWTGTIREEQHENSKANVWNEDVDYGVWAKWKTFPERLEENGVSWKIYQNEISAGGGFTGEEDAWLANFTDNPIEYFEQYNVRLSEKYRNYLASATITLPGEIATLEQKINAGGLSDKDLEKAHHSLRDKKDELKKVLEEKDIFTKEKYDQLSQLAKNLHDKAFTNNRNDPGYHSLMAHKYMDGDIEREVNIPKGDVLHQFRQDVKTGQLPAVSWLVAPETFSDHPGSAWYGAWYVSEVFDILTQNPEVWKKTIFILTYDENDGYFDHFPPFTAPNMHNANTGKASAGLDTSVDFVTMEQEMKKKNWPQEYMREGPIGLGYRVPMVVASPWSRGGWVCSQVFDHTSPLQFLEKFLHKKTGKEIKETNISPWRRAVCGDLTTIFRPYNGESISTPVFLEKNAVIEGIHKAKFKDIPAGYKQLSKEDIAQAKQAPASSPFIPEQEAGIRMSCALPYEIYADGALTGDKKSLALMLAAGSKSAGVPFNAYLYNKQNDNNADENVSVRAYTVLPGDKLKDELPLALFDNNQYHVKVYGPNGFMRSFSGNSDDPLLNVTISYNTAAMQILIHQTSKEKLQVLITDNSYNTGSRENDINNTGSTSLDVSKSFGWYDFTVKVKGNDTFERRYAGRMETGKPAYSDPAMGKV
ncbi:MAG TPA: phospholipase C, phosphocholine-specific [Chitinophagaceae bacterium]|nr:phospholipase C, phosphocholine-specific [Chitinophagaceae bacterium]